MRSIAASSSKSFSLKNWVEPCKAPRLLVLLIVLSNFRLHVSEGFCGLGGEGLVWRGCCFFPAAGGAFIPEYEYCRTALLNILQDGTVKEEPKEVLVFDTWAMRLRASIQWTD